MKRVHIVMKQKGQAVVEFALVLPLFFMLFWGIIYTGLLYSYYRTLSNLARESARSASIQGVDAYSDIEKACLEQHLLTNLYTLESAKVSPSTSSVQMTLETKLNPRFPGVGIMDFLGLSLPGKYEIVYTMYKETS